MTIKGGLLDFCKGVAAELEEQRNLHGRTLADCPNTDCKNGYIEPPRVDYDAHGSYVVPGTACRVCNGNVRVEVPCSPQMQAAAISSRNQSVASVATRR